MRVFITLFLFFSFAYASRMQAFFDAYEVPVVELDEKERVVIFHNRRCKDYKEGFTAEICDNYDLFDDGVGGSENYYKKEILTSYKLGARELNINSYYDAEINWNDEFVGKRWDHGLVKILKKTPDLDREDAFGTMLQAYTTEIYPGRFSGREECPSSAPYFSSAAKECTGVCDSIPNFVSRMNCYCNDRGWGEAGNLDDVIANGTENKNCSLQCQNAPIAKTYTEKQCQEKCDPTILSADKVTPCLESCKRGEQATINLTNSQCTTDDLDVDGSAGAVKPPEKKPDENKPTPPKPDKPTPPKPDNPNNSDTPNNNNNTGNNSGSNVGGKNPDGDTSHKVEIGNGSNGGTPNTPTKPGKDHDASKIVPPNNKSENTECKGEECGKPGNLPGEDIKNGVEKMFGEFEGFKNTLLNKTDSLKSDLENLKERITINKFPQMMNYEVQSCPYRATFTTQYFSIPLNFDVCKAVSILYPILYFLSFSSVMFLGINFFIKILMGL